MTIIRPPRVLVAVLAGPGLGISGTALQGMLRNPLVSPLGVTSGAAFGSVLAIALGLPPVALLGLAFAGGLLAISSVFVVAKLAHGGTNSMVLILAGVFLGAFSLALIVFVSLIVAAQVAVSGIVAWVGLVVPHCARMLVGPAHRRLLPAAGLLGALFVLGLDDLSRTGVHLHLNVGVLSALAGTPIVCFLLWRSKGKGWGRE